MARASFWQQLKALIRRNLKLKIRNKRQTAQEIFMPVYFVVLLAVINALIAPATQPSIPVFRQNPLDGKTFAPSAFAAHPVLAVAPNTSEVRQLMDQVIAQITVTEMRYEMYESAAEAEQAYVANNSLMYAAGVIFASGSQLTNYTLRVNYDSIPSAQELFADDGQCRSDDGLDDSGCTVNDYLYTGFASLQMIIDNILIQMQSNSSSLSLPNIFVQMMPKFEYTTSVEVIQILGGLYYVMSYAPFINFLTVSLVTEKEKKVKEAMRMMGLHDSVFWLSWTLIYIVIIFVVSVVIVLIVLVSKFFKHTNLLYFFLCLFLYGMSIVNAAFLLSPFFNKAQVAGSMAAFSTLLFSLLYLSVSLTRTGTGPDGPISSIPSWGQYLLSLLSPVALALAVDQMVFLDVTRGGLNSDTINIGQFPVQSAIIMLILDMFLYGFLALYLDNVLPNEYGLRREPWFCFLPSYWMPPKALSIQDDMILSLDSDDLEASDSENVEAVPVDMKGKEAIKIKDIYKIFKTKGKEVKAVNGITLDIYDGQIMAILGHNGAGKTTLFNMLSGMSPPTSGTASIYGLDVSDPSSMSEIRGMTGVCPQHNALFDTLTCREHLRFYGAIKGVRQEHMEDAITSSLYEVSLLDQADTFAQQLSGGQKRKLSVAVALIGDPKVIFLDEPTAGMDPASRRHLWSMLKNKQANKVILLTTHFMDEADILADRKAFISKGELICCGSSLYLKNKFGVGYHLTMVVDTTAEIPPILSLVQTHIPAAELERQHGKEISFVLPMTSADKFALLFGELEQAEGYGTKASNLGVLNYGVSMTNLEEVFLKLEENEEEDDSADKPNGNLTPAPDMTGSRSHLVDAMETGEENGAAAVNMPDAVNLAAFGKSSDTPAKITSNRFWALMKLRLQNAIQIKQLIFFQLVLPLLFTAIGAYLLGLQSSTADAPVSLRMSSLIPKYLNTSSSPRNPSLAYVSNTSGSSDTFKASLESLGIRTENFSSYNDLNLFPPHNLGYNAEDMMTKLVILYNSTVTHGIPLSLNIISNALLKMAAPDSDTPIEVSSKPWPSRAGNNDVVASFDGALFGSVLLLGMALSTMPAGFAALTVLDREVKARGQLRISGITMNMYWASMFCFQFLQYLLVAVLAICILLAFKVAAIMQTGAILTLILLFIIYLPVNMMFSYLLSFAFDTFETASRTMPPLLTWSAFLPFIAIEILDSTGHSDTASGLHIACVCLDPGYTVFGGLYYLNRVYMSHSLFYGPDEPVPISDYFTWESNLPITYIAPLIQGVFMYFLLRYLEIRKTDGDPRDVFCMGSGKMKDAGSTQGNTHIPQNEDEDVREEREKVDDYRPHVAQQEPVVVVQGLRKEFSVGESQGLPCIKSDREKNLKVAVHNNNFMVASGEVFGLLGPNGAGKTTTLNMIIAEEGPTAGQVYVSGYDVRSSLSEAFQAMGYCPQHDALWPEITPRQHLQLYAVTRGIDPKEAAAVASYFLESLKIEEHANKASKELSGGTKRKLSYAISMLGLPRVVLLDEPSTGMDPRSKRFLWDTISASFVDADRGAILTTHYMEEADALCNRVGIMVNGQMECLGTTQHLKSRFGSGYSLEVKVRAEADPMAMQQSMANLHQYILETFPNATQAECFAERAIYKIPQANVTSLALTFTALEQGKQDYNIQEYSFSQSSLEQVFLEFARHQLDEGQDQAPAYDVMPAAHARQIMRLHSQSSVEEEGTPKRAHLQVPGSTEVV